MAKVFRFSQVQRTKAHFATRFIGNNICALRAWPVERAMTYTISTPLAEAIEAAEKAGACEDDIPLLRALDRPGMTIGDIANHPEAAYWAYWFACEVIGGRFEAGEAAIAKDARYTFLYAKHVIGGRFEDWEAVIAQDARSAYCYAEELIKGRFEQGEVAIAKCAWRAYRYSKLPGVPSDWRANA